MSRFGLAVEMTIKRLKRPRDPAQLAKLVVDIATGQVEDCPPTPDLTGKDPAADRAAKLPPSLQH
jgi:hypothetical protein